MNNIPLEELRNMETTLIDTKNKSLELLTYLALYEYVLPYLDAASYTFHTLWIYQELLAI